MQGSGAIVYPDCMTGSAKSSETFFEFLNKWSSGKSSLLIYFFKSFENLFFYLLVLAFQIKAGNSFLHNDARCLKGFNDFSRNPGNNGIWQDIFGDYGTGPDQSILANRDAAEDCCIRTY